LDSISADLMSQAGASDAAGALNLVAGATVSEGKFAVIRGLPDRFVSSQLNGVRLPTADEDKRAVQLDQFPSPVIESIQVSKTFTPDQQGDASGGAVNVVLKGIPNETIVQAKGQISFNSQVADSDFLTYSGGGVDFWGDSGGERDIQYGNLGDNWNGAVGTTTAEAPVDYKWSFATGGKHVFDNGLTVGGFVSLFYERDSSFYDDGIDDNLSVREPGGEMKPRVLQADTSPKTALFDVTQGTELVQWGGLGTLGLEVENHQLNVAYLYTRVAEDQAILAEDTRGKEYFYPEYDPDDPFHPGNDPDNRDDKPYIRTETLEYTERTTETWIFSGQHMFPIDDTGIEDLFVFRDPELDWTVSNSSAELYQPDKRQFGERWLAASYDPGTPPWIPPGILPPLHKPFKPAANFQLGNLQRIWKEIEEESEQYALNLKLPFEQWSGDEGYLKFGLFRDDVTRLFDQETFSNFNDNQTWQGDWDDHWSEAFVGQDHPITDGLQVDVDYRGEQKIAAWYYMFDLPVSSFLNVLGGVRYEDTELSIINFPEADAKWFPEGALLPVALPPGAADVSFEQDDVLPSIGFNLTPIEELTIRGSYSETVARQTFKELTPILQQEFLGGPIFIGNPNLKMAALENWDIRLDYTPYEGGLLSLSWFEKDVKDPIEFVQRVASKFSFTEPENYPEGKLTGFEIEFRQDLGQFVDVLEGLSIGANATLIDSEVRLPEEQRLEFEQTSIQAPMPTRDMTNAPEHLYNLYLTYDLEATGTQFGIFYTVRGDTLVAGAGAANNTFVPNVYETEYETLNLSVSQKIGKYLELRFQAKNLTDPQRSTVYRSRYLPEGDVLKTSYSRGVDYSISLSAEIAF
ncbi:MAG: TonB-dependent receptor, partial [Planctomycetota bacterium]|nr:TonB-dependent receptor [Planctomycetota bacterium]